MFVFTFSVVMAPCGETFRANEIMHILDENNDFVDHDSNTDAEVNNYGKYNQKSLNYIKQRTQNQCSDVN